MSCSGADNEHDYAGDRETQAAHQCWWNCLYGDVDGEVSRAPEEIHQPEGKDDHPPTWARSGVHERENWGSSKISEEEDGEEDSKLEGRENGSRLGRSISIPRRLTPSILCDFCAALKGPLFHGCSRDSSRAAVLRS